MKDLVRKEYLRRVRLVARSRLYAGNLVTAVNVWAVSVMRYTAGVLDWRARELKNIDTKTGKLLTGEWCIPPTCGVMLPGCI